MEELEHEIEAAAVAEEPEQAEDEFAGEPEEQNTGTHPMNPGTCCFTALYRLARQRSHYFINRRSDLGH